MEREENFGKDSNKEETDAIAKALKEKQDIERTLDEKRKLKIENEKQELQDQENKQKHIWKNVFGDRQF